MPLYRVRAGQEGTMSKIYDALQHLEAQRKAMETGEESDPAMLERLRPLATAFSLGEGEQRALNLKLVRAY